MIIVVDPKRERGGGQVVLEHLLRLLGSTNDVGLIMPDEGRRKLTIPEGVLSFRDDARFLAHRPRSERVTLVSNANSALPGVARVARRLRRESVSVRTVAIVHNYPSNPATELATRHYLARFDRTIAVEPGVARFRAGMTVPSWLSLASPLSRVQDHPDGIAFSGRVKSFGRPDRSKGLHLLRPIFERLSTRGLSCHVAVGSGFDSDTRYVTRLRDDLAPWLEDGPRTSSWIEAGDVFVIPSVSGEAACLTAQEALSRGALVVSSRIGLMPYLSPDGTAMRTFAVGEARAAADAVLEVARLGREEFSREALAGVALIEHRAGRWYDETVRLIRRTEQDHAA